MPVVRRAYKKWKSKRNNDEYITEIKWMLINRRRQQFFTLREYAGDFFKGLDSLKYHNKSEIFYYYNELQKKDTYIEQFEQCPQISVTDDINDIRKFFIELFFEIAKSSESGTNFDYIQPLIPRADSLIKDLEKIFDIRNSGTISDIFDAKKMTVIQLAYVNMGTRELLPSLLSELIFQEANETKAEQPKKITAIVVDEAHNILSYDPNKSDLIHDNTLRVFEKIIKEGRKFGVFLYISSQRPSDISETISSQIHNYFIHKQSKQ